MKKILETVPLLIVGIFFPLIGRLDLLMTWPIITVAIYGILLNISQPTLHIDKNVSGRQDQNSLRLIVIGALLCFLIPLCDYAYGKSRTIAFSQVTTVIGLIMIWGGFVFRYWSIRVLGKFFNTLIDIRSDHQLVKNGPYKYFRHPSYLGSWISQVGISVLFQSLMGFMFSSIIYLAIYIYRIKFEEKALIEAFPIEYPNYKKETWGILPLVY